ncbi:MAG: decaprenyl-phosphate phosphoribosyltransferase [Candidatus Omnitrophica bacterium]|nr:decaprenyl-phosphate phosphoribosyltransferase [Candidatus Omnitrophota bacterium]
MKDLFFALRPQQWIKNFLVFMPLIFGKKLFVFPLNLDTLFTYFIFCAAASASYLINDIIDRKNDQFHPTKSLRPIAAGAVTLKTAWITAVTLGAFSIVIAFAIDRSFGMLMAFYMIFNAIYTKALKNVVIIDVFCLGAFFLLRVIGGSFVSKVVMSHWILIMTVLLAFFLGFNKRRCELKTLKLDALNHRYVLTEYSPYLIDQIIAVITSSVVIAYMLYTVDARTIHEFGTKNLIYSIPFVYYGIFRYLYLVHKLGKGGDPTRLLLLDRPMQINLVLWLGVCIAVIYF